MVQIPTSQEVEELNKFKKQHSVSIYLPAVKTGASTNSNRIRLKNLLREAETELLDSGVSKRDVYKALEPARALLGDHEFWPIHHQGLAVFLHPQHFRYYHLPYHTAPQTMTIGKGFDTEYLQQAIDNNRQYYVLSLNHKNIMLFEGDHYQLKPVHLKNFPSDMHEALRIDEMMQSRQTHAVAPAGRGKGSEATHQQYNVAQTDKTMLLQFFRKVDRFLHRFLLLHHHPLIIAGVDYLLPIYRQANTYPGLLDAAIVGNQEYANPVILKTKAWDLIKGSWSSDT